MIPTNLSLQSKKETMNTVTPRQEFLRDVAITAVEGGIGYWSSCTEYRWSETNSLDNMLPFPFIRIVPDEDPDDFPETSITAETIELGITRCLFDDCNLNSEFRKQIIAASALNDAGDIDADLADAIVQLGLFGSLTYG